MTGIWLVSNGEAFFVSFYDPKAVVTLELTILCGWWAELGLPLVTAMTDKDLQGLACTIITTILFYIMIVRLIVLLLLLYACQQCCMSNTSPIFVSAVYLMQGITVQIPKPDRKGRVDMAKATLHFDLGPPPPRSEIDCQSIKRESDRQNEGGGCVPVQARRTMLWKGFRRFGRRPVLLSFALDVSL